MCANLSKVYRLDNRMSVPECQSHKVSQLAIIQYKKCSVGGFPHLFSPQEPTQEIERGYCIDDIGNLFSYCDHMIYDKHKAFT